ncbi:hypothetical protein BGZ80_006705 [Entomortierella chlamydospora]|uniref:Uncharacterized protein n=1 Tax=Entomortierella chlamydospora TaxID=101097 RepID=A0A9P6MYR0_9FUNG|nr:hypothetical protein BGZ80_006705 [Entomortierella chlamydospora]
MLDVIHDYLKSDTIKNYSKTLIEIEKLYQPSRRVFLLGSETLILAARKAIRKRESTRRSVKVLNLRYKNVKTTMAANHNAKRNEQVFRTSDINKAQKTKAKSTNPPCHARGRSSIGTTPLTKCLSHRKMKHLHLGLIVMGISLSR